MKRRVHLLIKGRVQGIFFRAFVKEQAMKEKVVGFVRNTLQGEVEVVIEGEKENVEKMIAACKKGPPLSQIDTIDVKEERPTREFTEFTIKRL
jgi:acylphosphatase